MNKLFDEFFTGINYWCSKNATHMWTEYDPKSVENDMKLLKDVGVTVLRVFPKWDDFQPLTAFNSPRFVFEYGMNGEVRPDTEAGKAGVDEEMCRKFEHLCAVADKYGIKLIVALLTGHMSGGNFIPSAFNNLNVSSNSTVLKWELKYIKYIVKRFKCIKNIVAWDLGNEIDMFKPDTPADRFYVWCSLLADAVKAIDNSRPVLSGIAEFNVEKPAPNLLDISESCDINTVHAYRIFNANEDPINTMKPIMDHIFKCRLSEDVSGMPTFLQEFGALGYVNCSKQSEAEFYRATVLSMLSHGFHGVMYWCAFDQGHLTFPPYDWNNIGSNYGFFDKDLDIKPIAEENLKLQKLLNIVGKELPKYNTNCTIVVPREEYENQYKALRSSYMLAERVGLKPDICYGNATIPASQLYIFPSLDYNRSINYTRFLEILNNVEKGATLYMSMGKSLFKNLSALSGTVLDNMVYTPKEKILNFGGTQLPINVGHRYDILPDGCEVLGTDENGQPFFVKNRYGKGYIYVLFAPLEQYLADKPGAFFEENTPDYEKIYGELKSNALSSDIIKIDSKFILHTEHIINEDERYIFMINYSMRPEKAELEIADGYKLTTVWGEGFEGKAVSLRQCDGILLKASKN